MAPVAAALEVREKMSESPGHNKMVGLLEDLLNEAVKGRKGATVFRDLFFEETLGAIVKAQGQRICAFDFFGNEIVAPKELAERLLREVSELSAALAQEWAKGRS